MFWDHRRRIEAVEGVLTAYTGLEVRDDVSIQTMQNYGEPSRMRCIEVEARAWELTTSGQQQKLGRVRGGNGWQIGTYQRSVDILNACSS